MCEETYAVLISLHRVSESLHTQFNQMQEGGEKQPSKAAQDDVCICNDKLQVKWVFWELGGGKNVRIPFRALTLIQ